MASYFGCMASMWHYRRQCPVGQGFFHSALVGGPRSGSSVHIHYVYDCGATKLYTRARDREIKRYRDEVRGGLIDLLFLSHMHADHVNGLPKLLSRHGRGPKVDTVVMPLVDDIERLIAFAGSLTFNATEPDDPFYQAFTVDAVSALAGFSPRQIILVRIGQRGAPGDGAPDFDAPSPEGGGSERPEEETTTGSWKLIGSGKVTSRGRISEDGSGAAGTIASVPRVLEMEDTVAIAIGGSAGEAWLLAPYIDPGVRRSRRGFLNALANRLRIAPRILAARLADTETRSELIANKQAALKAAYESIVPDVNLTSMTLLSTPISSRRFAGGVYQMRCTRTVSCELAPGDSVRIGWLGTGDADLKKNGRLRAFLRHYRRHLSSIYTLTVPHHGAERNFNKDLVRRVRPNMCTLAADQYLNWRHPATSVVQAIASAGIEMRVATSAPQSAIEEWALLD